jgi:hypothetical protein
MTTISSSLSLSLFFFKTFMGLFLFFSLFFMDFHGSIFLITHASFFQQ